MIHRFLHWYESVHDRVLTIGLFVVVFLSSIYAQSDRDQGWHYRYGEYFFQHGKILTKDIYSWTLPGYAWANHSWLYDVFLYVWTNMIGFFGLSLLAALVSAITFWFITASFQLNFWKKGILAAFFIWMDEVVVGSGMRSQIISLMLFSILVWILIKARENMRWLWSLPFLFMLWSNLHGDFTLAMGAVGVYLGSYFLIDAYKEHDFSTELFVFFTKVILVCLLASLLNPFTYQAYFESFRHASNPYLRNILEWDPINDGCGSCHPKTFLVYGGVMSACLAYSVWKKNWYAVPSVVIFAGMASQTWETRRLLPVFCVLTIPLLAEVLSQLKFSSKHWRVLPYLGLLLIIIGVEFNLYNRIVVSKLWAYGENAYCEGAANCSVEGTNFLIAHPPQGKGLNFYDWGGYMIGKGVPVKLFVDGRMHVWRTEDGYQPFGDYIEIYYNNRMDIFDKYDLDWIYVPSGSTLESTLLESPQHGHWTKAYEDVHAVLLLRDRSVDGPAKI